MSDYYWIEEARKQASQEIKQLGEAQQRNAGQLLAAFNRMAQAIENLTQEVRQLRDDLNPKMDKVKIPAPESRGG